MDTELSGITPLNYCAHAIDYLNSYPELMMHENPESAHGLRCVLELLERSIKFVLPNCCELIDRDSLGQAHLELMKLPYPVVALEAPWDTGKAPVELAGAEQTSAPKRIALCWEPSEDTLFTEELRLVAERHSNRGVFVLPIYCTADGIWCANTAGAFLPYLNEFVNLRSSTVPESTSIAHQALIDAGIISKEKYRALKADVFLVLPEFFDRSVDRLGSEERALAEVQLDCRDEINMVIQTMSVLNCANVKTFEVTPPQKLNKKRIQNKRIPFLHTKYCSLTRTTLLQYLDLVRGHIAVQECISEGDTSVDCRTRQFSFATQWCVPNPRTVL
jgi:hypothetical protein